MCFDLAHWIFAIKYWDLSHKLKEATAGTKQNTYRLWLTQLINGTMWVVILGGTAVYTWSLYYRKNLGSEISERGRNFVNVYCKMFALVPCLCSLVILLDAFRRMYSIRRITTQISSSKVFVHALVFLFLFICDVLIIAIVGHLGDDSL